MVHSHGGAVRRVAQVAWLASAALLLVLSWFVLFLHAEWFTGSALVPYENRPAFAQPNNPFPPKPPRGTWERAVNDFFEHRPGRCVPGGVVVAGSAIMLVATLPRRKVTPGLLLALAATNLIFVVFYAFAAPAMRQLPLLWLPQPRSEYDAGYHRTWPEILLFVVLSALLIYGQWWLCEHGDKGRKLTRHSSTWADVR